MQAWEYDRSLRGRAAVPSVPTNKDGEFQFSPGNRGNVMLLATKGNDRLSSANFLSSNMHQFTSSERTMTQFFTDRSIYRPGQTIRYKGICIQADQDKDRYQVLPKQPQRCPFGREWPGSRTARAPNQRFWQL